MNPTDRSDYVYLGLRSIPVRFALFRHAAKATRIIHTKDQRIEDSMNAALMLSGDKSKL